MKVSFQCQHDARGDLWMCDGTVIDRGTGAFFPVGDGDPLGGGLVGATAETMAETAEIPSVIDMVFLGGSGSNVIVSGLAALDGFYRFYRPGMWKKGDFLLEVTGPSAATISDETDVVAELTTGGDAPGGSFVATTYGEDTYNASVGFTLTAVKERGWPGGFVDLDVTISDGTAVGGRFSTTDGVNFVSVLDADWTFVLNADGTADFSYDGTVIATRAAGPPDDPCGGYVSTPDGERLNPDFGADDETEPVDFNPFGTLTLEYSWPASPDLDDTTAFLGGMVGFGSGYTAPYMTHSGDDTGPAGSETVVVDLAAAWDAGAISTFADVLCMADWYPPHGGSGPATLTATYDLPGAPGTPVVHTLHPSSTTPASTPALALRILQDGTAAPVGGPWTATVKAVRRAPLDGVVYIEITEVSGSVTAVGEPVFDATLPSPGGGVVPFPLATSDGAGLLKQLHTGPLVC
ncbi:MAG: hypothetical protein ABIT37_05810 [Luteolibacter sp.]